MKALSTDPINDSPEEPEEHLVPCVVCFADVNAEPIDTTDEDGKSMKPEPGTYCERCNSAMCQDCIDEIGQCCEGE